MTAHRLLILFASLNGALAVGLGAFAAHGAAPAVKTLLTTGAHYQLAHALLALFAALWAGGGRLAGAAGWCAALGGLVFSLSLALVGLAGLRIMGAVAPIGGALMIAGWAMIALAAARSRSFNKDHQA